MVQKGRILIADGETAFLESTCDLLKRQGFACDSAMDAAGATDQLRRNRYDVMISGIEMPGNFKLELVDTAREIAQGMPIILITGSPSLQSAIGSIGSPVCTYLVKPIEFEKLLLRTQECVKRSQISRRLHGARAELTNWRREMEVAESLFSQSEGGWSSEPVNAFVAMNLKSVAMTLVQLSRLTDALTESRSEQEEWEAVATAQLDTAYAALTETIGVLEQTRDTFKSKRLAKLRRHLQAVVDLWTKKTA